MDMIILTGFLWIVFRSEVICTRFRAANQIPVSMVCLHIGYGCLVIYKSMFYISTLVEHKIIGETYYLCYLAYVLFFGVFFVGFARSILPNKFFIRTMGKSCQREDVLKSYGLLTFINLGLFLPFMFLANQYNFMKILNII